MTSWCLLRRATCRLSPKTGRLSELKKYDRALTTLIKGRARSVALAGEDTGLAFDKMAKQFEDQWGLELFQKSLSAFQKTHLSKPT